MAYEGTLDKVLHEHSFEVGAREHGPDRIYVAVVQYKDGEPKVALSRSFMTSEKECRTKLGRLRLSEIEPLIAALQAAHESLIRQFECFVLSP